jgi:hypothetical protein
VPRANDSRVRPRPTQLGAVGPNRVDPNQPGPTRLRRAKAPALAGKDGMRWWLCRGRWAEGDPRGFCGPRFHHGANAPRSPLRGCASRLAEGQRRRTASVSWLVEACHARTIRE